MDAITYHDEIIGTESKFPLNHRNWKRETGDIMLKRVVSINLPLELTMQIKVDGSIVLARTKWVGHKNTYWHYSQGNEKWVDGKPVCQPLSRDQEETIALLWADKSELIDGVDPMFPKTMLRGIGASVQRLTRDGVLDILQSMSLDVPPIC